MNPQARDTLELLSTKLRRIRVAYEWARARGDIERISQFEMQLNAATAERDRLVKHVSNEVVRN